MLVYIGYRSVEIACDLNAHFTLALEPGIWTVTHNKTEYAVTSLSGTLRAGALVFSYPRGVERRANGAWSARERIVSVVPDWPQLPGPVREVLNDAYLLQRHDLPETLETL